jgi:hypothetical protein
MKKNLYLHIGTHKTGSTSIQHFLKDNTSILKSHGYYYPTEGAYYYPPEASASLLAHAVLNRRPEYIGNTPIDHDACVNDIQKSILQSGAENIIVSSEHFSHAHTDNAVQKISDVFLSLFENIIVIIYLRRQDLRLESMYAQGVKTGSITMEFNDYLNASAGWNYYDLLKPWINIFGLKNIVIRPFENSQFFGNSLINDFMHLINCEIPIIDSPKKNQSPPIEYLELQRIMTQSIQTYPERKNFLFILSKLPVKIDTKKYTFFQPDKRKAFLELHQESNKCVATEYLDRSEGILFYDKEESALPVYTGMNIEKLAQIARQYVLLCMKNQLDLKKLADKK